MVKMMKKRMFGKYEYNLIDISNWRLTPYQVLSLGFAGTILFGALLLMLPIATISGEQMRFIDALFTATSAVCVTGLVVVDTGNYFSIFGQMVIILLIQVGAFGFMTMAILIIILMRRRLQLRDRLIMQEAMNKLTLSGIAKLVQYIVRTSLWIEFIGGTILAIRFYFDFGLQGIYYGYWHAVSAYCNAGFDILGADRNNMMMYVEDITVNLVITSLIIIGGLGFAVNEDIMKERNFKRLSLHTKVVLTTTACLIAVGTVSLFIAEYSNPATMGNLSLQGKVLASYFQSVTARTAGYCTVPIGELSHTSIFLLIVLMFIGTSPASTGGGIKTTTFAVIAMSLWSQIRGNMDVNLFYRRIAPQVIQKAFTLFIFCVAMVVTVLLILTSLNPNQSIAALLFEVVSAFSTTGLSMGITAELGDFSKAWIVFMMFLGRVGPVTFALALALRSNKASVHYPEGKITIG